MKTLKKLLIVLFSLTAMGASAQMNYTTLKAYIDSNIYTNTTHDITGDRLNDVLTEMARSALNVVDNPDPLQFKGFIDCSANPNYPAADAGDLYVVSVAGKIGGGSGKDMEVGDYVMCTVDGTSAGAEGSVGTRWKDIEVNIFRAVTGPSSSTAGHIATFNGTSGKVIQDPGVAISTDSTFSSNSNLNVPTERAIKYYVDSISDTIHAVIPHQAVFATNFAGTVVTFLNTTGSTGGTDGVACSAPGGTGLYQIVLTGANLPTATPNRVKVDIQNFVTGGQNGLGGNVVRRWDTFVQDSDTIIIRVWEGDATNNVDETLTNYDWTTKTYPDGNALIVVTIY